MRTEHQPTKTKKFYEPRPVHSASMGKILAEVHFKKYTEIINIGLFWFKLDLDGKINPAQLEAFNLATKNLVLYIPRGQTQTTGHNG